MRRAWGHAYGGAVRKPADGPDPGGWRRHVQWPGSLRRTPRSAAVIFFAAAAALLVLRAVLMGAPARLAPHGGAGAGGSSITANVRGDVHGNEHGAPRLAAPRASCIGALCDDGDGRGKSVERTVVIDLAAVSPMSDVMYGAAFEEINHAGDGGLNPERVADPSFGALAYMRKRLWEHSLHDAHTASRGDGGAQVWTRKTYPLQQASMDPETVASANLANADAYWSFQNAKAEVIELSPPVVARTGAAPDASAGIGAEAAGSLGRYALHLSGQDGSLMSMLVNHGHALNGIVVEDGESFVARARVRCVDGGSRWFALSLMSSDLATAHASQMCECATPNKWGMCQVVLKAAAPSRSVRMGLSFKGRVGLQVDFVSLTPSANWKPDGSYVPFEASVLSKLSELSPSFLRFPGGAFVEGVNMSNAYRWKTAVGPTEDRPGHPGANWGYWSSGALGLFEFMQLCEVLSAQPVWVVNAGISQSESVVPDSAAAWDDDALDSLEFLLGPPSSKWGAVRARMGRRQPYKLQYVTIGNEDCLRPHYLAHFKRISQRIRRSYPYITIIANCDLGQKADFDMWEFHKYCSPDEAFELRKAVDAYAGARQVAVTEFAVMRAEEDVFAAVAEAGLMSALERNCEKMSMVAYAPLLANEALRNWRPDLIILKDGERPYGTVSCQVQAIYRRLTGTHCASVHSYGKAHLPLSATEEHLEVSATCLSGPECARVAVKAVNFGPDSQPLRLVVARHASGAHTPAGRRSRTLHAAADGRRWFRTAQVGGSDGLVAAGSCARWADVHSMSIYDPGYKTNSFEHPDAVQFVNSTVSSLDGRQYTLELPSRSFTWLVLECGV